MCHVYFFSMSPKLLWTVIEYVWRDNWHVVGPRIIMFPCVLCLLQGSYFLSLIYKYYSKVEYAAAFVLQWEWLKSSDLCFTTPQVTASTHRTLCFPNSINRIWKSVLKSQFLLNLISTPISLMNFLLPTDWMLLRGYRGLSGFLMLAFLASCFLIPDSPFPLLVTSDD